MTQNEHLPRSQKPSVLYYFLSDFSNPFNKLNMAKAPRKKYVRRLGIRRRQVLIARLSTMRRRRRCRMPITRPIRCTRFSRKQLTLRTRRSTSSRLITKTSTTLTRARIVWRSINYLYNRIYYLIEIFRYYKFFIQQFCIFWFIFLFILFLDYCNKADINWRFYRKKVLMFGLNDQEKIFTYKFLFLRDF